MLQQLRAFGANSRKMRRQHVNSLITKEQVRIRYRSLDISWISAVHAADSIGNPSFNPAFFDLRLRLRKSWAMIEERSPHIREEKYETQIAAGLRWLCPFGRPCPGG
ncbi:MULTISPECIES: hypothetical protein [Phyllobacterium]|jgi:hypothetical protein|uniref:hypothetical protein n=1 Tax=Phyllobacterium TaxID=28100 RepID=UPI0013AED775|nr:MULTISPECIES: hypothetical protein [Phyllobacterium]UXN63494.1 hypothetical protein N8E89_12970 [Phyllobacterium sp. A18/5-2]